MEKAFKVGRGVGCNQECPACDNFESKEELFCLPKYGLANMNAVLEFEIALPY